MSATSFVEAIKEVGITINNENVLIRELDASDDKNRTLESLCVRGNDKNISFFAGDLSGDSKLLTKAFKDHGFDGFTFRTFLANLKTEA